MEFLPTQREVTDLLRQTGALRHGHFEWPSGLHTNVHLETALVMRYFRYSKTLSVGLSRLLRATPELRAVIPELSIVAATPAGLPVACCLCEALRARQVYWAERDGPGGTLRFPQYLEPSSGEKVVLVDDILRSGMLLSEAKAMLETRGAQVLALAVLVHQPTPETRDFRPMPLHYMARIDAAYYTDASSCELCREGAPVEKIGMEPADRVPQARLTAGAA